MVKNSELPMKYKKISFLEIQAYLNNYDLKLLPRLNMTILRNITLEPIEPYLRYLASEIGFNAQINFGEYDNIVQETLGGNGTLLNNATDCVLVFSKLNSLSQDITHNFAVLTPEKRSLEVYRIKGYISSVLNGIRKQTNAMILWHSFELPTYPALGILDYQINTGQVATVQELNNFLRDELMMQRNSYLVDLNLCLSRIGSKNFFDNRYWHIGRAPYTRDALSEIAHEDFKFIRALKGKNKKCLVLDCDNTLWGGIVGEDGLSGIKLGKTYPGSTYLEFQQEIVNLYNRGIVIALCSKNNEDDVREVFAKHPDMILKEEHIATAQINWQDKAANLKRIAEDLNIGLDSIVFADDSEFECNLIRDILPEVEVIHLSVDRAIEYREILASFGMFCTLTISDEDKKRGAMYKAESLRKKLKSEVTSLEEYLKSLEIVLKVSQADDFSIPRIAQLTQRTNQFNLTTRRYSESDIHKLIGTNNANVIYITVKDKFGDSGMVGVCILKYKEDIALLDSFLLSCRILGRGVEDAFLQQALKLAQKKGLRKVIGEYSPTKKNGQVANFYSTRGFIEISNTETKESKLFGYDLNNGIQTEPAYFKEILSDI